MDNSIIFNSCISTNTQSDHIKQLPLWYFLGCSIWLFLFCILIDIKIDIFLNGQDIGIKNVKIFFLDPPWIFKTVLIYDLT